MTLQIVELWVSMHYEEGCGTFGEGDFKTGQMPIGTDPMFYFITAGKILINVIKHVGTALSSFVVTRKNYML